jgi:pre-mRNA-splicing factor ATP-dependent RNA helicase DHX15/PRP43
MRALELLNYLGALDDDGNLTEFGMHMSDFPLDPQFAKCLMTSPLYNVSEEILSIIAMLNVPNPFMRPKNDQKNADAAKSQFEHEDGDHITLLHAFQRFIENGCDSQWAFDNYLNFRSLKQAQNVRQQLERYLYKYHPKPEHIELDEKTYYRNIRKVLASGYFMQVAHLEKNNKYFTSKDNQVCFILSWPQLIINLF